MKYQMPEGPCCDGVATRELAIPVAMKRLGEAVNAALESVHRLRTRLNPVLQPANQCPAKDSPDESPPPCPPTLARSIGEQVDWVAAMMDQIEDIICRLEL